MRWESILCSFRMVPQKPSRSDFYGPYNKLMYGLFPGDDYLVTPRFKSGERPSPYFRLEVSFKHKPVLMLDIRRPKNVKYSFKRQETIGQIQKRIEILKLECPLPALHVVSAFGTKLRFCKVYRDQTIPPPIILSHPEYLTNMMAPYKFWDCDILSKEGEKRFKSMVEEINQACAAL